MKCALEGQRVVWIVQEPELSGGLRQTTSIRGHHQSPGSNSFQGNSAKGLVPKGRDQNKCTTSHLLSQPVKGQQAQVPNPLQSCRKAMLDCRSQAPVAS